MVQQRRTTSRTVRYRLVTISSKSPLHLNLFLGICGGSASGKTTVAQKIIEYLGVPWVTLLSLDSFYKVLNEKQHEDADRNEYNFDHPDAFDFELLIEMLQRLKEGRKVEVPIYNFVTHSREARTVSKIDLIQSRFNFYFLENNVRSQRDNF